MTPVPRAPEWAVSGTWFTWEPAPKGAAPSSPSSRSVAVLLGDHRGHVHLGQKRARLAG